MKHLLILIALVITTGCATNSPPMERTFWNIYSEDPILSLNDCTNMSAKYARILRENGHEADFIYYELPQSDYAHVVVKTKKRGTVIYCDVVNGKYSLNPFKFGDPTFTIKYEDRFLPVWGDEFKEFKGPQKHDGKTHSLFLGEDGLGCSERRCVVNALEKAAKYVE
jgi:hypothetical protein